MFGIPLVPAIIKTLPVPVEQIRDIAIISDALYRQWNAEALSELLPSVSDGLKGYEIDTVNGRLNFESWMYRQAKYKKFNAKDSLDGLVHRVQSLSPELGQEIVDFRDRLTAVIQYKSDLAAVNTAQTLAEIGILNACMISGQGSGFLNWVLVKLGAGNTHIYGGREDSGIEGSEGPRVLARNYPGLTNDCKDEPRMKLNPGQKIVVEPGGIYLVNKLGERIRELTTSYIPNTL